MSRSYYTPLNKGQIRPKADWRTRRAIDSPKRRNKRHLTSLCNYFSRQKKIKPSVRFFGRIRGEQIVLSKLSDLQQYPYYSYVASHYSYISRKEIRIPQKRDISWVKIMDVAYSMDRSTALLCPRLTQSSPLSKILTLTLLNH